MIDRATVDKIMDAVNIVDVVGEFVNLRKSGVNYKGLCPFHDDKTPSFRCLLRVRYVSAFLAVRVAMLSTS